MFLGNRQSQIGWGAEVLAGGLAFFWPWVGVVLAIGGALVILDGIFPSIRARLFVGWPWSREGPEVPLYDFIRIARDAHGWDITGKDNSQILELLDGIRSAGRMGRFRVSGRKNHGHPSSGRREPHAPIPAEHWQSFQIDFSSVDNARENFDITTYSHTQDDSWTRGSYRDLRLERGPAIRWLRNEATSFRGTIK